jgi:hypothetical protein
MKQYFRPVFLLAVLVFLLVSVTAASAAGYILPFRNGSTAIYGPLGVHDCGFSLTGWKAVDLLPAENQVYAVETGDIAYVCRDGTQVALRVNGILYDHLVDNGQEVGDHVTQGESLGSMVTGSFNAPCGYADQQAGHWHVHFCFVPTGGKFYADGYTLDTISGNWEKDGQTIRPNGQITAAWGDVGTTPPSGELFNVWDYLLKGLASIFNWFLNTLFLPPGSQGAGVFNLLNFSSYFSEGVLLVIELSAAALSTFNLWIPLLAFAIDMVLFSIQLVVSIYNFITGLIKQIPFL